MSEMTNRTVDVSVRVYSGSDDHAKHIVFWALHSGNIVFRDDDAHTLEEILTAVSTGEQIADDLRDQASGLLEHLIWDREYYFIDKLETRGGVA